MLLALELCDGPETGWGRANGLGGPDAPAECRADADGDGGGRTTPEPEGCSNGCPFRCACDGCKAEWGDESPVGLSASDSPSGICTFKMGRSRPPIEALFVREGGWNTPSEVAGVGMLRGLAGDCGGNGGREAAPTSIDCERTLEIAEVVVPLRGVSPLEVEDAQC